ncbi:helical backbone metal receptor [Aquipuribacter hungaricus]|uniref:ABC transporter substrate-binding protein n=1 Tax=Aquipuribacter hungaricus TaxID=545624 RepID=A0ABV7WAI2_9MICO
MTARTSARPPRRTLLAAAGTGLALALAACGGASDDAAAGGSTAGTTTGSTTESTTGSTSEATAGGTDAAFPVTVTSGQEPDTTEVTIDAAPASIVSISPSATEMLYAVGAGDQVVAVDSFSYFPEEAPVTDLSGFEPNVEAILGYAPDLVIASSDPGDLVSALEAAGVPTLLLPSALDIDESYDQIERVGAATGHVEEAAALTEEMAADIEAAVASVPEGEALTYYHELDPSFFTASGDTFIGEVYGLFGLENIADETGEAYPQLSQEFIVEADPDVVFVTSGDFSSTPEEIAARPGWEGITAVEDGDVVVVDADVASRWGPRVVDFVETVAAELPEVRE